MPYWDSGEKEKGKCFLFFTLSLSLAQGLLSMYTVVSLWKWTNWGWFFTKRILLEEWYIQYPCTSNLKVEWNQMKFVYRLRLRFCLSGLPVLFTQFCITWIQPPQYYSYTDNFLVCFSHSVQHKLSAYPFGTRYSSLWLVVLHNLWDQLWKVKLQFFFFTLSSKQQHDQRPFEMGITKKTVSFF